MPSTYANQQCRYWCLLQFATQVILPRYFSTVVSVTHCCDMETVKNMRYGFCFRRHTESLWFLRVVILISWLLQIGPANPYGCCILRRRTEGMHIVFANELGGSHDCRGIPGMALEGMPLLLPHHHGKSSIIRCFVCHRMLNEFRTYMANSFGFCIE